MIITKDLVVTYKLVMVLCPKCGAEEGKPCRTPKGRISKSAHDTRPFRLDFVEDRDGKKD